LSLVTASGQPLKNIVSDEVKTSPFFNIFQEIILKPFSSEDIETFVQVKGTQAGFSEQERALLLQFQEPSPLQLQLAGQLILEDKKEAEKKLKFYSPDDPSYKQEFEIRFREEYEAVAS